MSDVADPCRECPWRKENQGKRHAHGFYTKANLTRLWNQIRRGENAQSCHPTDPGHPDHGAKPNSKPKECAGSVILVRRELARAADESCTISEEGIKKYLRAFRRTGLTKTGFLFWVVQRIQLAGVPMVGKPPMPNVDDQHPDVAKPAYLEEP